MAQQVTVKIELENGKQITHYSSLRIMQNLFKHHEFELIVPFEALEKDGEHFFNTAHEDVCGKAVTFSFDSEYDSDAKSKFSYIFKGIITEICLRNQGNLSNTFIISGYSPTILLEDSTLKRTFLQLSVQDIFSKVLGDYPANVLKTNLKANSSGTIKYTVQYNETNFEFLNRMAAEYGEWFFYNGQELQLGKGTLNEADFDIDGVQAFDMSISLQPSKFKLGSYDYSTDSEFENDTTGTQVNGLSDLGKFALTESEKLFSNKALLTSQKPIYNQGDLDEFAKLKRSVSASDLIVFDGKGEVPDISVGTVITVKGSVPEKGGRSKDQQFGKYMVIEITHNVDENGNYSNSFQALPESVNYPPPNPYVTHPVGQTETAKIINNKDDNNLGRVKVAFLWPDNKDNESDWIRVGTFYGGGGDGKGMFFVPEVDAHVLVDYELNHPEYPFVVTTIYPQKNGTRSIADKNSEKYIYTQAGNQIKFYDDDNENKIEITNENKTDTIISISFKDKGTVSIKTSGLVEINADDKITINAQNEISMQSQKITIEAQNDLTLKGTSVSVQATNSAEIKGTQVSLKGDAQTEVSGGVTKLSATGITTIQGSVVKIN